MSGLYHIPLERALDRPKLCQIVKERHCRLDRHTHGLPMDRSHWGFDRLPSRLASTTAAFVPIGQEKSESTQVVVPQRHIDGWRESANGQERSELFDFALVENRLKIDNLPNETTQVAGGQSLRLACKMQHCRCRTQHWLECLEAPGTLSE